MNIFKDKKPNRVSFIRNKDGTYKVVQTGLVCVDNDNKLLTNVTIEFPRCEIEWDKHDIATMPFVKEILKSDDEKEELFSVLIPDKSVNKEYPLCPKVNGNSIPRCINLRDRKYCSGNLCS